MRKGWPSLLSCREQGRGAIDSQECSLEGKQFLEMGVKQLLRRWEILAQVDYDGEQHWVELRDGR